MGFMDNGKPSSGSLMMNNSEISVVVITVSDRSSKGIREDKSGPLIVEFLKENNFLVTGYNIIPDEKEDIVKELNNWINQNVNLIFTTGGTGFAPRDITPEATSLVIERETPGLAEYLRYKSFQITPHATLSRGVAGIKNQTLIVNLPGSPKAAKECVEFLLPVLPHAIELLIDSPESENNH